MRCISLPVAAIKLSAVTRCARSAHTRPRATTRSNRETLASRAARAACRRRATFSWGVSSLPGGFEERFDGVCGGGADERGRREDGEVGVNVVDGGLE